MQNSELLDFSYTVKAVRSDKCHWYIRRDAVLQRRSGSSGHLVADDCCAKRTMSPRSPLVDTFLGIPFLL